MGTDVVQIPILSGIYTSGSPDFRTSLPVNLVPVPKTSGISSGYLRPGDGIVQNGVTEGRSRGGINWNGVCYRVMGGVLIAIDQYGVVDIIGIVGEGEGDASFDYSFDLLAIASAGNLFYYDGATLQQASDPDLGTVVDVIWIDGYFMTTDGEYLVVTDLDDPYAVNPLKYGSSEADPDPVLALLKLRNEAYALNRYTIEVFDNIGGALFPFQRIEGAQIEKGCVGTNACCIFMETAAFLGSGFNEQVSVYLGVNGSAVKIATHEIDIILAGYTEEELRLSVLETRNEGTHQFLYVHLPDRALVYDAGASAELQQPIWFVLTSSEDGFSQYLARHFVRAYDKWLCADTDRVGYLTGTISTHWGERVRWEFGTLIVYNEGSGAIFHELELVGLTGSYVFGAEPVIASSYSVDGVTWSQERFISAGATGQRAKRLCWFQQGHMRNWRIQRFRSNSDCHAAFARMEARLEPLQY